MIETTVVGSYPARVQERELDAAYEAAHSGKRGPLPDPFQSAIRDAVDDQVCAGIDIISAGQVRSDMIAEFTRKIARIRDRHEEKIVMDNIQFTGPITLADLVYAKCHMPHHKKIKGTITGPYTLAKSCTLAEDAGYASIKELAFDFAQVLNQEARALAGVVSVIQIDEPFFSQEFPQYGKDLITFVREGIATPIALHVCGDVAEIFPQLALFPVDILDHEFSTHPALLDTIRATDCGQRIGYGCVNSFSLDLETPDEIARKVEQAMQLLGEERIIMDPDCGLRNLPRDIAFKKLEHMVIARNLIYGIATEESQRRPLTSADWDPRGYFYILVDKRRSRIRVEHYDYEHTLSAVIQGTAAESLLHKILD
ncbi:MAG: methionine synthase, partial [Nanoarchaeota archaeon]